MSLMNKNFNVDDRVKFVNTSDSELDKRTGTVIGKSVDNLCDFYIVLLDAPYMGQKGINITESCIELV